MIKRIFFIESKTEKLCRAAIHKAIMGMEADTMDMAIHMEVEVIWDLMVNAQGNLLFANALTQIAASFNT